MNDEELANKLVECDIGERRGDNYWIENAGLTAYTFVRDWRTAGAVIKKCAVIHLEKFDGHYEAIVNITGLLHEYAESHDATAQRAINESFVRTHPDA